MCCVQKTASVLALCVATVMTLAPGVFNIELTVSMIDCAAGLTASNRNFAATNGLLRADIEMNGTAHLYESKETSKKWLYYTGEFDLNIRGQPVNISQFEKIVLDYSYRWGDKTYCLQMQRFTCN